MINVIICYIILCSQVLIDFNCGSNQYSQIQNNLLLLDIINVSNDSFYYDTVATNAIRFLMMNS